MRKLVGVCIVLQLICTLFEVKAQKVSRGYLIVNSKYTQGILLKFDDKVQFQASIDDAPKFYSVQEVAEFSIGKNIYESIDIEGSRVFAERLVSGNKKLYKYRGKLFLKSDDGGLIRLTRGNYDSAIPEELRCEPGLIETVVFSKLSIKNFLDQYNEKGSSIGKQPFRKFGLTYNIGLTNADFVFLENIKFSHDIVLHSFGLYAEAPLYTPSSVSVAGELQLVKANVDVKSASSTRSFSSQIGINGAIIPVSVKWSPFNYRIKPFFKAGPSLHFLKVKADSGLKEVYNESGNTVTSMYLIPSSKEFLIGYHGGIGTEISLANRRVIHLEMRYSKALMGSRHPIDLSLHGLNFLVTFSL